LQYIVKPMKNKDLLLPILTAIILLFTTSCTEKSRNHYPVIWNLDNLNKIGGFPVEVLGDPEIIETEGGKAIYFDGVDDGLLVMGSPVEGASAFTVEVVFRPDSSWPDNAEQRFVHIQNPDYADRRIMIETRLTPDNKWFLDSFIRSESSTRPQLAKDFKHELGKWQHAAVVYENGIMKHYVNGKLEMSGEVIYLPINNANVSLGVRMNKVFWFKGAIRTLKVTNRALPPNEFLRNHSE